MVLQAEHPKQPNMQGTFKYLHLFYDASCSLMHLV